MPFYKSGYFVPAISLGLFALSFKFGPSGLSWFWADQPMVAVVLAATSVVFWRLLILSRRNRSHT